MLVKLLSKIAGMFGYELWRSGSVVPVRGAIVAFSDEMEAILADHDDEKGTEGWKEHSYDYLLGQMYKRISEMHFAFIDPKFNWDAETDIRVSAAKAANYLMMIADNFGNLRPAPYTGCR